MAIDAKTVAELRRRTGLPMMECKEAREAAAGLAMPTEQAYLALLTGELKVALGDTAGANAALAEARASFAASSNRAALCECQAVEAPTAPRSRHRGSRRWHTSGAGPRWGVRRP